MYIDETLSGIEPEWKEVLLLRGGAHDAIRRDAKLLFKNVSPILETRLSAERFGELHA
ncbi:MAG: hypothetical protein HN919_10835 [Verrucomicrobia bacterium]|nr:hypothetical protein [Verrucomicrobiota bacterium]